jgi:hypothetical protein
VKVGSAIAHESAQVADALRAERARLGFDYGKFDFISHDGRPILFDVNRTPGAPPARCSPSLPNPTAGSPAGWTPGSGNERT